MDQTLIILIINAVLTPILVIVTLWVRANIAKSNRMTDREDGFITGMEKRLERLEKEIREVRIELKNRDAEYLELYKEHTTLKAKYEVLSVDHEDLKKKYEATVLELSKLGTACQDESHKQP